MTRVGLLLRQKLLGFLSPVSSLGGWRGIWSTISEPFAGAWQRNIAVERDDVLRYSTVWACITLLASDISKLWVMLTIKDENGISTEAESPAFSPVLRKPNHYSTRVKFIFYWFISLFSTGNTYVLKERDNRRLVVAMHILDPSRVTVLVAPDGSVFYQLSSDNLAGIETDVTVPAREIIHDLCVPMYHPLVGVSPIVACWLSARTGLKIQESSAQAFAQGLQLSGVLTAPKDISATTAQRIQDDWDAKYMGPENRWKVAVLGDGLHFEPMQQTAVNAQLAEQLKMSDEKICACFHIPPHLAGVGPPPPYNNVQALNLQYYSQALQHPIENFELLLEEGLELPKPYHIEMDLEALLRMDTATLTEVMKAQVSAGITSPNEARATFDRKAVAGGDTPYMQEQNWPLKLLAGRELPVRPPTAPVALPPASADKKETELDESTSILLFLTKAAAIGLPTQKAA